MFLGKRLKWIRYDTAIDYSHVLTINGDLGVA